MSYNRRQMVTHPDWDWIMDGGEPRKAAKEAPAPTDGGGDFPQIDRESLASREVRRRFEEIMDS